jgi:hypothetical protein
MLNQDVGHLTGHWDKVVGHCSIEQVSILAVDALFKKNRSDARAAERWRSVKVTEFERRQTAAVRKELDEEYEAAAASMSGRQGVAPRQKYPATLRLDPCRSARTFAVSSLPIALSLCATARSKDCHAGTTSWLADGRNARPPSLLYPMPTSPKRLEQVLSRIKGGRSHCLMRPRDVGIIRPFPPVWSLLRHLHPA